MAEIENKTDETHNDIYRSKSKDSRTFLCGQLDATISKEWMDTNGGKMWKRQIIDDDNYNQKWGIRYKDSCNFYYKGYIDSLYRRNEESDESFYSNLAEYEYDLSGQNTVCCLHKYSANKLITSESIWFNVKSIRIYIFPHNVVLCSIEIVKSDILLNDLTNLHYMLREVANYESMRKYGCNINAIKNGETHFSFENYIEVIEPLIALCRDANNREFKMIDLVKNGNKFKLFQIVEAGEYYTKAKELSVTEDSREQLINELLYEVGTVSMVGVVNQTTNKNSPSKNYFDEIIHDNIIEPFRNWKALAIFDTFTVVYTPLINPSDWARYFRLIYLHALYQKTVLFELNQELCIATINKKELSNLVEKMRDHECYYEFPNISYNVQPQMIYEQILKGLKVGEERIQMKYYLERENERQEKVREKRRSQRAKYFNIILIAITITTLASAIYDTTSLVMIYNDINTADNLDIVRCYIRNIGMGGAGFTILCVVIYIIYKHFFDNED